jgi:hypothetical protein
MRAMDSKMKTPETGKEKPGQTHRIIESLILPLAFCCIAVERHVQHFMFLTENCLLQGQAMTRAT